MQVAEMKKMAGYAQTCPTSAGMLSRNVNHTQLHTLWKQKRTNTQTHNMEVFNDTN